MRTDKELLDALQEHGWGIAVIHDDEEHWVVGGDGAQSLVVDGPHPFDTSYWIDEENIKLARRDIREAINAWIDDSAASDRRQK